LASLVLTTEKAMIFILIFEWEPWMISIISCGLHWHFYWGPIINLYPTVSIGRLEQLSLTHTHNHLWPFVHDYPGEPVLEETFTHSHLSWSSSIFISFFHLLWSIASSLFNLRCSILFCVLLLPVINFIH